MRGKNILWFALVAVLFGGMMTSLTFGQCECFIYIDPPVVHNEDMSMSVVSFDIKVECVDDLYGYAFVFDYAPFSRTLAFSACDEGDFLKQGGYDTSFIFTVDNFAGKVKIGNSRIGEVPGASGDGILATVDLKVVEADDRSLDFSVNLEKVELYDSTVTLIPCDVAGSYYYGPYVNMISASWDYSGRGDRPWVHWKDTLTFCSSVTNYGDAPLQVKVKYDLMRADGRITTIWAGQTMTSVVKDPVYLYIDGYSPFLEDGWVNPGASVIGTPDGSYAESTTNGGWTSAYTFEDITLAPGDAIDRVVLEGYCQYPNGATENVDIDVYTVTPVLFTWLGSLYGDTSFAWVEPRWIAEDEQVSDVVPGIRGSDPTALNDLSVLIYAYHADPDNPIRVDSLRVRVEFAACSPMDAPVFIVEPGETLDLDPAMWALAKVDKGFYTSVYVTCYYSYFYPAVGFTWIPALTEIDLGWLWIPGQGPGPKI